MKKLTTYSAKKLVLCLENRDLAEDGLEETDTMRTTIRDEYFTELRLNTEEKERLAKIKRRYLKEVAEFYDNLANEIQAPSDCPLVESVTQ